MTTLVAGPATSAPARVAVAVLQWGRADETLRCLEALRKSEGVGLEVVVADNRSPEREAAELVRAAHPWVTVVENEANLGFAGGNNRILARWLAERPRSPRYAFVLNNDVEVAADCLRRMLDCMRRTGAAAVGALNFARGTRRLASSGGRIAWPSARYVEEG